MDLGEAAGQVTLYAGAVTAGGAALALIWKGGKRMLLFVRRVVHLVDDFVGEPAHGDQAARPGLMQRLGGLETRTVRIEAELHPNHGGSLRDAVNATAAAAVRLERGLAEVQTELAGHLAEHRDQRA